MADTCVRLNRTGTGKPNVYSTETLLIRHMYNNMERSVKAVEARTHKQCFAWLLLLLFRGLGAQDCAVDSVFGFVLLSEVLVSAAFMFNLLLSCVICPNVCVLHTQYSRRDTVFVCAVVFWMSDCVLTYTGVWRAASWMIYLCHIHAALPTAAFFECFVYPTLIQP